MGSGYSSYTATGLTPEEALGRLMNKVGYCNGTANFGYSYGTRPAFDETTAGTWVSNVVVMTDATHCVPAEINELWDDQRGYYYRAWFNKLRVTSVDISPPDTSSYRATTTTINGQQNYAGSLPLRTNNRGMGVQTGTRGSVYNDQRIKRMADY